jgi:hypothetical protein
MKAAAFVVAGVWLAACGTSQGSGAAGDDGGGDATVSDDGGGSSGSEAGSSSGAAEAGEGGGSSSGGGPVSCSAPSTAYSQNFSGTCGTFRWAVKTGTDSDVGKVNLVPQVTTVAALTALGTSGGSDCTRTPTEQHAYELKDVSLRFERLEADGDYHIVATQGGKTMIVEVPYPGCVGHDSCGSSTPLLCDITHARAAVDAKNPSTANYQNLGTGTVIGIGFYDTYELQNNPPPTGMATNGIELHPVLAICFGQGCDPLQGY